MADPGAWDAGTWDDAVWDGGSLADRGCSLRDGWRVSLEGFYNTDGRLYGDGTYGSELYGDEAGQGIPSWQDMTRYVTEIAATIGSTDGAIDAPVSSLEAEILDSDRELYDWPAPATYFDPDTGTPIRLSVYSPAGDRYTLGTWILDAVEDVHELRVRRISVEAFDLLTQYVTDVRGWTAPGESLLERVERIAGVVQAATYPGEKIPDPALAAIGLVADTDPEDTDGLSLLRLAALSAGGTLDTDETGRLRVREWPLAWDGTDPLVITDRLGAGDVAAPVIGYRMDLERALTRVVLEHRDGTTVVVDDLQSSDYYGPRTDAQGFPLSGLVWASLSEAEAFAERVRLRRHALIKRPEYVDLDVRTDPRALPILAELRTGAPVIVRRTGYAPDMEHRAVVIGMEHEIRPNYWRARIHLDGVDQTIGDQLP